MTAYVLLLIVFTLGIVCGSLFTLIILKTVEKKHMLNFDTVINEAADMMKSNFAQISMDTLSKTAGLMSDKLKSERELSSKELDSKKELIEQRIELLNNEISRLNDLINNSTKNSSLQISELKTIINESREKTSELFTVTNNLRETLSSKQNRGQWAERMADDILMYAGLKEGINYLRQHKSDITGKRPDFTFLLPNGMSLNMDVKFPFDNYKKYLESDEINKHTYAKEFIKDVKNHIKAISGREYIDPENNTVNCMLMFIPNERIYSFIFDTDAGVLDDAARQGVMICSPVTIISILAVIRQASENFVIEKRTKELMAAMGTFRKEWLNYSEKFNKMGDLIRKVYDEYNTLQTTRSNKLESSMRKVESLEALDDSNK